MNDKNFQNYINCLIIAKRMLKEQIIDEADFNKMEETLKVKYCIKNNTIYRSIDLIYSDFRGNM